MNDPSANPLFVALLFILRCIVPLAVLFGVSYLLRKLGLVAIESPEPPDDRNDEAVTEDAIPALEETVREGLKSSEANPNEIKAVENNKES
jgi:hypothetical protein